MSFGWTCSNCTYRHHAPCERCVMCGELRVTRKQMIDFVQGIPIPAPLANVPSPPKTAPNKQATLNAVFGASGGAPKAAAASPAMTHNPYAKKRPASAMGQNSDSNSHNKSQNQSQMMERPRINEEESEKTRQPPGAGGSLAAKPMVPPNPPLVSAQAPLQPTVSIQNTDVSAAAVSNNMPPNLKDPPPEHPKQPLTSVNTNTNAAPVYHHQQQQTASSATFTNNNNNNNNSRPNSSKFHRPGVLPMAKPKQTVTKQRASDASDNNNNNNNKDSYQYALSRIAYLPGPVPIDPNTAHEWVYPESTDYPTRQYQLEISKTAILHNTLVSLPTGLGKTLIAAVVMYNYHRWFPSGKVIFLAPTLPLVQQQIKACYDIMGIPTRATAMLTGKTSQDKRLLLWQEKSVFFCTPQTVQKDLESSTCPAQEVVCVVLDEAHRAAGKYAYVNVINLLEHSGSKFRVLGLSATPGANIKAIQQVIDVLKINRIEARHESELAQYTHTRTSEIIIVPQVAASKGIEAAMNAIIDPLLNRLRQAGCFQRFGTNSSIACYNIMKESEAFKGRTNNDNTSSSMSGYFFASQKFVQIRDFLHKQGVGMVRTKINEMRTTRQMGMLSNIVKSPEFARLWEEVTRATCDPNAYETNARDRLVNNPKLGKLCEILKEHFERARACSKSSRAIVFSQYRDSVSEIVTVLESYKPMIRSRHFVGQGKGSTKQQQQQPNSNESQQQQQQVQGMNQAEQQTVVREFRNDVYNVLVCTCIGEEGLDIGEVDLIVNFDTLSSPIRSLQRIGRTGRKREGRVVCLVSEGAEEKTMNAAKQKERTLQHALKNPKAFTSQPTVPLFRTEPVLVKRAVHFSQNFRGSQVEGVGGAKTAGKSHGRNATNWKLTDDEEAQRLNLLRQYAKTHIRLDAASKLTLRRRLLVGRGLQLTKGSDKERLIGKTVALLRKIEAPHAAAAGIRPTRIRRLGCDCEAIDTLFPLLLNDSFVDQKLQLDPAERKRTILSDFMDKDVTNLRSDESRVSNVATVTGAPPPLKVLPPDRNLSLHAPLGSFNDNPSALQEANQRDAASVQANDNAPLIDEFCLPTPPDSASSVGSSVEEENDKENDFRLPTPPDAMSSSEDEEEEENNMQGSVGVLMGEDGPTESEAFQSYTTSRDTSAPMQEVDEFRLPSPASFTSSSALLDDDCDAGMGDSNPHQTTSETDHIKSGIGIDEVVWVAGNNQAPPPPIQLDETPLSIVVRQHSSQMSIESVESIRLQVKKPKKQINVLHDTQDSEEEPSAALAAIRTQPPAPLLCAGVTTNMHVRFNAEVNDTPHSLLRGHPTSQTTVESVESMRLCVKNPNKKMKVLQDTQDSPEADLFGVQTSTPWKEDALRDTQSVGAEDDAGDILCAVCGSGVSPDEDPIILCDGQRDGTLRPCDLSVHMTCYSVLQVLNPDDQWYCDACVYRQTSGSSCGLVCSLCHGGEDDGAMKLLLPNNCWQHVKCNRRGRLSGKLKQPSGKTAARVKFTDPAPASDPIRSENSNSIGTQDYAAIRKRKRREHFRRFIQEEADCDSEDDVDGDDDEEDDLRAIEEEEELAASGFINDSSQLGFTQDALDGCDPDAHDDDGLHREVDAEQARFEEFETPLLNRRFLRKKRDGKWSDTPPSAPSSQKGLGNMHFIRSVLEHHRHGGQADDIEQAYQDMEEDAGVGGDIDPESLIPEPPQPQRQTIYYEYAGSDSE